MNEEQGRKSNLTHVYVHVTNAITMGAVDWLELLDAVLEHE